MDSVTQFVLGASVGAAVLGRHLGVRRAALTGGLLGTLPDLDVYLPAGDPVESFVGHRGATHSLVMHAVVTPLLGEGLLRVFRSLRDARPRVYLAVFLCLTTHALIDAMTIYGTRLFWPLWDEPLGLGSIFIIDPIYTLPLLIMTLWAFCRREWSQRFGKSLTCALAFSTLYLGWTAVAQQIVEARGKSYLEEAGIAAEAVTAGPTPLNSLFWRLIAIDRERYFHVYIPLLGGADTVTAYQHDRWAPEVRCWAETAVRGDGVAGVLARFADGYYQVATEAGKVIMSDLRMGLYPQFVFRFVIAEAADGVISEVPPERQGVQRRQPGDTDWLVAGILGERKVRAAERAMQFERPALVAGERPPTNLGAC